MFARLAPLALILAAGTGQADPAVVKQIVAKNQGGSWRIDVTVAHGDTGWEDYADGWRVETEDGRVLDTRELLHPHVDEQPFTRAVQGVVIPEGDGAVYVRTRTNVDGWDDTRYIHRLKR